MFIQTASCRPAFLGLSERTLFRAVREPAVDCRREATSIPAVITGGDHFVTLARLCPQVYSDCQSLWLPRRLAPTRVYH
jgi:hypothetical protein